MDQVLLEFYSMKKHEDESLSSFNKRFVSFYYNMPKEIQPLEGAPKLHYVSTFLLKLSFFILERKLVTLQHMFIDSLEVQDNITMSRKVSNQDRDNIIEEELELVE